jgi:hypothetical protein
MNNLYTFVCLSNYYFYIIIIYNDKNKSFLKEKYLILAYLKFYFLVHLLQNYEGARTNSGYTLNRHHKSDEIAYRTHQKVSV